MLVIRRSPRIAMRKCQDVGRRQLTMRTLKANNALKNCPSKIIINKINMCGVTSESKVKFNSKLTNKYLMKISNVKDCNPVVSLKKSEYKNKGKKSKKDYNNEKNRITSRLHHSDNNMEIKSIYNLRSSTKSSKNSIIKSICSKSSMKISTPRNDIPVSNCSTIKNKILKNIEHSKVKQKLVNKDNLVHYKNIQRSKVDIISEKKLNYNLRTRPKQVPINILSINEYDRKRDLKKNKLISKNIIKEKKIIGKNSLGKSQLIRKDVIRSTKSYVQSEQDLTKRAYNKLAIARQEKRIAEEARKDHIKVMTTARMYPSNRKRSPRKSLMTRTLSHNIAKANHKFQINQPTINKNRESVIINRLPEGLQPHATSSQRDDALNGYNLRLREAINRSSINCTFAKAMDRNGPEYRLQHVRGYNPLYRPRGEYSDKFDPAVCYRDNYVPRYQTMS